MTTTVIIHAADGSSVTTTLAGPVISAPSSLTPVAFPPLPANGIVLPPALPSGALGGVGFRPYTGGSPARTVTWATPLPKGLLQPSDHVSLAGTPIQMDVISSHADGSVRLAAFAAQVPAMAAGQWCSGALDKTATPLAGAVLQPSPITGTIAIGTNSFDASTLNVAAATVTKRGPLAVQWTITVPAPQISAPDGEFSFDVEQYADGTPPLVDVRFARSLVTVSTAKVTIQPPQVPALPPYTATMTNLASASGSLSFPFHALAADWYWTANECPVFVVGDTTMLRAAGAMLLDDTCGVPNSFLASLSTTPANPFTFGSITAYMPTTGDRAELAPCPEDQADWLLSMDPRAALHALRINSACWSGVPWHYRDSVTHNWVSPFSTPQVWLGGPGYFSIDKLTSGSGWTPDAAHAACFAWVPWMLTGRLRYWRDLSAQASEAAMYLNPPARQNDKAIIVSTPAATYAVQTRGQAWGIRTFFVAAAFAPDIDPFAGYFKAVVANNIAGERQWIAATQNAANQFAQGELATWVPGANDMKPYSNIPPWCGDYLISAGVLGDALGFAIPDIVEAHATCQLRMSSDPNFLVNYPSPFQVPGMDRNTAWIKTWAGAKASILECSVSATLSFNGPVAGDFFTINGTRIDIVASGATGNQINVSSGSAMAAATIALINASSDPNLQAVQACHATFQLFVMKKDSSPVTLTSSIQSRLSVTQAPIYPYASDYSATTPQISIVQAAERYCSARLAQRYPSIAALGATVQAKFDAAVAPGNAFFNGCTAAGVQASQELRWRML